VFKAIKHLSNLKTLVIPELNVFLPNSSVIDHMLHLKDMPSLKRVCINSQDRVALQSRLGTLRCEQINVEALPEAVCECLHDMGEE
jgi:hypothetical protein